MKNKILSESILMLFRKHLKNDIQEQIKKLNRIGSELEEINSYLINNFEIDPDFKNLNDLNIEEISAQKDIKEMFNEDMLNLFKKYKNMIETQFNNAQRLEQRIKDLKD